MITELITEKTFRRNVVCKDWEEVVDVAGGLLVDAGSVEPPFLTSIKETVSQYGAYMVLIDDIALFHGRPEAGVKELSMSLVLLQEPVYLLDKRVQAGFVFAALDNSSHLDLLQELAWSLDNDAVLELLCNNAPLEDILKLFKEAEAKHEVS